MTLVAVIGQVFERALNNERSIRIKDLFCRAIKLKKELTTNDYLHPPPEVAALNAELDELLKVDYSHASGGYRNKDGKGAERFTIIRFVIDTAIKNGQLVFAALRCIAECCPR